MNFKRSKFNAIKTNGYDSKKEYKIAKMLEMREKAGEIECLQKQVKYELIPAQYRNKKCIERAINYIADFTYVENGETVVADVKGWRTKEYRIKRKLMLFIHDIIIKEL